MSISWMSICIVVRAFSFINLYVLYISVRCIDLYCVFTNIKHDYSTYSRLSTVSISTTELLSYFKVSHKIIISHRTIAGTPLDFYRRYDFNQVIIASNDDPFNLPKGLTIGHSRSKSPSQLIHDIHPTFNINESGIEKSPAISGEGAEVKNEIKCVDMSFLIIKSTLLK